jgi:ABC-type branched-subunit amino acid transport system substrate-binding protein
LPTPAGYGVIAPELPASPIKTEISKLAAPFTAKYGGQPSEFAADAYSGAELLFAALKQAAPGFSCTGARRSTDTWGFITLPRTSVR